MGTSWTQSTAAAKFTKKSIAVQALCRQDVNEIVGTSWTLASKQDQIFYTMKKRTKYICKFQIPIWTCWGPQVKKLFWVFFGMGQFVCVQNAVGLVFDSYIQVLGIRYFQWPCTSYHCPISVGLVSLYKYYVLGIFKGHVLHIIVVYQWVLSLTLIYKY